jgi:hypothetical protein
MFRSIEAVQRANANAGRFWFSKDTMAFFHSRLVTGLIKGCYFITSECREPGVSVRRYTVHHASADGVEISTVGEFMGHTSALSARTWLDAYLTGKMI